MNRDRFLAILRYLKVCDEEVESQPQQVAPGQPPPQRDKLYKGQVFLRSAFAQVCQVDCQSMAGH